MNIVDIDWKQYNIKEDAAINPSELDVAWLEQANLVAKYGKALARAEMEVNECDERVKSTRSRLVIEANEDPSVLGDGVKATAQTVEAFYRNDSEYQKQKGRKINAESVAERLRSAINVLYHRRSALENLVRLHGSEYFAGPRVPRDLVSEWDQKQRKAADNVKAGSTRRRRTT